MSIPSGRRLPSRGFALWGGAMMAFFAVTAIGQLPVESATTGEGIFASLVAGAAMVVIPICVGGLLIWWAFRGWRLDPQPRWMTAMRGGLAGGVLWAIGGTLGYAAWLTWVEGVAVGNLVGLIPSMTAPVGFILGAIAGWWRPRMR
jgi:hypothetical protein